MNITMLSMQENQEIQTAEMVADLSRDYSENLFQISEDISSAADCVEEACQTSTVLENIQNVLNKNESGIPPMAIEALRLSIEHMTSRLGYRTNFKSLSLENYNCNPKENIRIAMESLSDIVASIYRAIINSIKKVASWVSDFLSWLFKSNKGVSASAESIQKRTLEKAKSPEYSSGNFDHSELIIKADDPEFVTSLTVQKHPYLVCGDGSLSQKPLSSKELFMFYKRTSSILDGIYKDSTGDKQKNIVKNAHNAFEKLKGAIDRDGDGSAEFRELHDYTLGLAIDIPSSDFSPKERRWESKVLLGNFCVYSSLKPNNDTHGSIDLNNPYKCGVDYHSKSEKPNSDKRLFCLSMQECAELSGLVKENQKNLLGKEVDALRDLCSDLEKEMQDIESDLRKTKEINPKMKEAGRYSRNLVNMIAKTTVDFSRAVLMYRIKLDSEILRYIINCEKIVDYNKNPVVI